LIRRFTPWRDWTFPASAGFDVHFFLSFLVDQTGRFGGQRLG
jgi:hypothetical protein